MTHLPDNTNNNKNLINGNSSLIKNVDDLYRATHNIKEELHKIANYLDKFILSNIEQIKLQNDNTPKNGYTRNVLYTSNLYNYQILLMNWSPGHQSKIHDHDNYWCIESLVKGQINVTEYTIINEYGDLYELQQSPVTQQQQLHAKVCIPPDDLHMLCNPSTTENVITLHIYESAITSCNSYVPQSNNKDNKILYKKTHCELSS